MTKDMECPASAHARRSNAVVRALELPRLPRHSIRSGIVHDVRDASCSYVVILVWTHVSPEDRREHV